MNNVLLPEIDRLIKESRDELAKLTVKLVNIKSEQEPPLPGAPFGAGVKRLLDTVVEIGNADGFYTRDYNVGVVSVSTKEGQPDLGIWVHGDVVPAGEDWEKGRGGAHGIDEAVSLDRLQRCMKIYARALLALNDMEW